MTKAEIAASKAKFLFCVKEIKRYSNKLTEAIDEKNSQLLNKLKAEVENLKCDLQTNYLLSGDEDDALYGSFTEAKDIAVNFLAKIDQELCKIVQEQRLIENESSNLHVGSTNKCNNLKLPKLELPVFDGDLSTWLSFKEIFLTAIDQNKELTEPSKFSYLISALKGDPAKLISGFSISENNYKQAWETLLNRYDNKKNLAYALLSKFLNARPVKPNSQKSILELLDTCNLAIRNLKSLKFEFNEFVDLILVFIVQNKFDDTLRKHWELSLSNDSFPTYDTLVKFLEKHARSMQGCNEGNFKSDSREFKPNYKSDFKSQRFSVKKSVTNSLITENFKSQKLVCPQCNSFHALFKCPEIQKLNVSQRWNLIKEKGLCSNCLRANHFANKCLITARCKYCSQKHHTLLHSEQGNSTPQSVFRGQNVVNNQDNVNNQNLAVSNQTSISGQNLQPNSSCLCSQTINSESQTLLSTAVIKVKSNSGDFIACRAMLDSGSQKSLVSEACCRKLGLSGRPTIHKISGINNLVAETSLQEISLIFSPYFNSESFEIDALVVKQITTNLPNFRVPKNIWPHLDGLKLADPNFHISSPIDILIGADLFANLIVGQSILGPKGSPSAINSKLGWILSGIIHSTNKIPNSSVSCHAEISGELQKFWELESIPNTATISTCEDTYSKTVTRTESGRYIVDVPFKSTPNLGNSENQALKRFTHLENKLQRNPQFKELYSDFMKEYIDLKHMEPVPKSEISSNPQSFYLPHHGVFKEDSTTTKLRVVFDASATGSEGHSLNDYLEIGPKLQPDLLALLLKFRIFPIGLTADLEKMYRMILVNRSQIDFQRILWRFNPTEPLTTYRLVTLTYGTASAAYLAIRTLHQLAHDYKLSFPEAARIIIEDFYVDDLLTGANSVPEAQRLVQDLIHVMENGGFTLRKWSCNVPTVISNLPDKLKSSTSKVNIQEDHSVKILGLFWNSSKDVLQINITNPKPVKTKRELLSVVASIFDPLGLLSPTTIRLKIMLQDLWRDKVSWDEQIPSSILSLWNEFHSQINVLKLIEIPRYVKTRNEPDYQIQLHGFCDGSGKAYAAVTYLRIISPDNEISVHLLAAKTRENPIKHVTLPRIELCAAFLLSKLCATIIEVLPINIHEIFLWSDSQIVLSWIHSPPSKGNQFVLNRVNQIKALIPLGKWNHVSGALNPSDCASRGILPHALLNHPLWWSGPAWLSTNELISPPAFEPIVPEVNESPEILSHVTHAKILPDFLLKFSSFSKLSRVTAWCLRFINNANHSNTKITGSLTSNEISKSITCIVKNIQQQEFAKELNLLKEHKPLPNNHKFLPLNVFLDSSDILRVGGRLSQHQSLTHDHKHPMLLPRHHLITKLLIQHFHEKNLHAGAQLVLSLLRQKYWFVSGRSTVRQEINKCLLCKRLKAQSCQQLMGSLPVDRITPIRPFSKVGIDFAGPFLTKPNVPRSKVKLKSYISVFVCMCTKALHIELVSDLSSQALLAALRRFIGRRGHPSDIYSDNGKNFKGLSNHLKELFRILHERDIQDFASQQFISWHFIPPYSPHFGGIWEAAVKLTKNHLLKTCKSTILNFEELTTLLCQVEACVNSRPLTPLSADPSDVRALTPGHFLIGTPLLEIPDVTESTRLSLTARWDLIQRAKTQFWSRWSRDYLHHLQQRPKWNSLRPNLKIWDLVVVHDRSCPPLQWRLGRITNTFPGPDKLTRVVSIRTRDGELKRPITKVTLLNSETSPGRENVES